MSLPSSAIFSLKSGEALLQRLTTASLDHGQLYLPLGEATRERVGGSIEQVCYW